MKKSRLAFCFTATMLFLLSATVQAQDSSYHFRTVNYPGASVTYVRGIDDGNLVGFYFSKFTYHGFYYDLTTWKTIDYPSTAATQPTGVDGGKVVGYYISCGSQGFVYDGTTWTSLGYAGSPSTRANGIDGSKVVGSYYEDGCGPSGCYENAKKGNRGFIYDGSAFVSIHFAGASDTYANGIEGITVVGSYLMSGASHGFVYDGNTWTTVDYPGATDTRVNGIGSGVIVGSYSLSGRSHGFLYDGHSWISLDYPDALDTYLYDIDNGYIVGTFRSSVSSDWSGFLATPVPAPSPVCLLISGLLGLIALRGKFSTSG